MKKLMTIIMVLAVVFFSQCRKPGTDDNTDSASNSNAKKVKVSCTISLNKETRSDFSNLMETGKINWSEGRECVYVAIHGEQPTIIELEGFAYGNPSKLEFTGEVAENLLKTGTEYDIWYFGHSQQLETPYINMEDGVLEGSISNQTGRLEDLGYNHIAKTTVTAETVNGEVRLNLNGTLTNQIALAMLDLENVTELYGSAIKGTEYKLAYDAETERFEFDVTEDAGAKIKVESATGISYVVLLPNENKDTKLKCVKGGDAYATTFYGGIKANKVYFRTATDGVTKEALAWTEIQELYGHEYVDLGLPSGLLWATCNIGATSPEAYGDYFAWGEIETKETYTEENSVTYGRQMNDISGNAQFDAATANWGGSWRIPTKAELEELFNNCEWTKVTQGGVIYGFNVTGPNGNSIHIPTAGCYAGSSSAAERYAFYISSSTPSDDPSEAVMLNYFGGNIYFLDGIRNGGISVRPVIGGDFTQPAAQYAFVDTDEASEITANSAVCGGNVTTDNGYYVTSKGICWSTSENPTINDNKTNDGDGTGSFTSELTDLEPNTIYYVRAYATNLAGTAYGKQVSFTTEAGGGTPTTQTITVNGVSFTMIAVEGGTFDMGATSEQGSDAYDREKPVHSVTLSDYSIGETEVTQELWEAVMGSNPSSFSGYPQRPVERVSWNDCQDFITRLNELTGKNFRLPTEAEWEYAARGGNKSQGYKYSGSDNIDDVAWYKSNSSSQTHDVKTKAPNELGIYDMSGNVCEWCQDWYGSYSSGSQTNPTGPSSGSSRVGRGGGWGSNAGACRGSYRIINSPDIRNYNYGLRLVL